MPHHERSSVEPGLAGRRNGPPLQNICRKDDYVPGAWRGGSFAISYSKINDFNNEVQYSGINTNSDIIDFFVQDANLQNVDPDDLIGATRDAYYTYLLSEFADVFIDGQDTSAVPFYERTFFAEFPTDEFPTTQSEVISTSGSQNQWSFPPDTCTSLTH